MRSLPLFAGILAVVASPVAAGPDNVVYPEGYPSSFVRYATVDRPDRDPPIVRFLYVNPEALAAAQAGEPLPYGTVLVMEDHLAELDDQGQPATFANSRFVPTTEVTNIFVQEKREGWGAEYPPEVRNGEWEYGRFLADGSVTPDAKFEGCFECHKGVEAQDFNFSFSPFVGEIKN
jgi:hypothetical protein